MNRKNFIKLTGGATLSVGISNALVANSALNKIFHPLLNCSDVTERVIVIVRMAGANDGLNTLVPLSQYASYSTLRPDIRLSQTGSGSLINLDSTLNAPNQIGIHPVMTGFKSLYDSGKLAIIHSAGYPSANYSHFLSENIMYAGKDGTTSNNITNGWLGRYLDSVYPGLSGNPLPFMPDPLAVHFGSSNPSLGYTHNHGTAEYNATTLQGQLFSGLSLLNAIPQLSEYNDVLNYIRSVEQSMDSYYNRIIQVFNAGSNSTVSYPNTDLAKQLKTVARLLKGGSKTKIFQTTLGGFDTHASQIVSGASSTGTHANLLADVSGSISSFIADLAVLGLEDKVMIVTFSEFGRKAIQNGSLGTDHGDIAPMFVIGKHVKPGVVGVPPNLSNVLGDGRFAASERQFDYRQVYTTLLQDWLGADNATLTNAELDAFQPQKLNLVTANQNASPNCLSGTAINCSLNPAVSNKAYLVAEISGWSYYAFANASNTDYVFGIEKRPSGTGANTNAVEFEIDITTLLCTASQYKCFIQGHATEYIMAAGEFFNCKAISVTKPNGFVNIRWFLPTAYINDLNAAAGSYGETNGVAHISPIMYLKKTNSKMSLPDNLRSDGLGIYYAATPMTQTGTGVINGKEYTQFNSITNIHGTGAGAFCRLTSLPSNDPAYNIPAATPAKRASIRFNSLTKTFEGHDGTNWQPLY